MDDMTDAIIAGDIVTRGVGEPGYLVEATEWCGDILALKLIGIIGRVDASRFRLIGEVRFSMAMAAGNDSPGDVSRSDLAEAGVVVPARGQA